MDNGALTKVISSGIVLSFKPRVGKVQTSQITCGFTIISPFIFTTFSPYLEKAIYFSPFH